MIKANSNETAKRIAQSVSSVGGRAYFVGGFVRDRLLGTENKDIDIEVHGVSPEKLREILSSVGEVLEIGENFGIFSLKGCNIDVAMPRRERLYGTGHRDFDISVDPFIGTKKAAERRDFTVNALMEDVLTGEIIDHFDGLSDLKKKVLRHVNDTTFQEDPLRVLRLAQFAARFGFFVAEETKELCKTVELSHLSRERVEEELKKAMLKAEKPSVFFEVLRQVRGLDFWFPELKKLIGIGQNPKYHPEGDVWTHTMEVIDRASRYRDFVSEPFSFMMSSVCHDLGKIVATTEIDGVIHAYNHEVLGLPVVREFLSRIIGEKAVISYCLNMTKLHMKPLVMVNASSSMKAFNKMFDESIAPKDLIMLSICDKGNNMKGEEDVLFQRLREFYEIMERPFVQGRDLIEAGLPADKSFGEILAYAHKLRLAGVEKNNAMKQVLSFAKKLKKE